MIDKKLLKFKSKLYIKKKRNIKTITFYSVNK